jgi:type I restriction enzyme S subunit
MLITENQTKEMGDFRVPVGYRPTELGLIPDDWEEKCLGDIASIATGSTPPTNNQSNYGNEFLFVSPADISKEKFIVTTLKKLSKTGYAISRKFPKNSILFTCIGSTIGKCAIASVDLTSNQQINAVLPSANFSHQYLYYSLCSAGPKIRSLAGEQAVPIVNKSQFSETVLAIPPLAEQEIIADVLSDIDSLITSLDQLIVKKRNIKLAAMQQLLTGKQRLPGFKDEWSTRKIGEFTDCLSGGTPSTFISDYWGGSIRWMNSGELNLKTIKDVEGRITEQGLHNSSTKMIPKKCVLIGLAGQGKTRGTVAINLIELCTNQSIAAILPNNQFIPEYLYYNLDARYEELRGLSTGDGGRGGLNLTIIRSLEIPFPGIKEQAAIAKVLTDIDTELSALQEQLAKARNLKQGMMQELLTGRIRLT